MVKGKQKFILLFVAASLFTPHIFAAEVVEGGAPSAIADEIGANRLCLTEAKQMRDVIPRELVKVRFRSELQESAELIRKIKSSMKMDEVVKLSKEYARLSSAYGPHDNHRVIIDSLKHNYFEQALATSGFPKTLDMGLSVSANWPWEGESEKQAKLFQSRSCLIDPACEGESVSVKPRRSISINIGHNGEFNNGLHASLTGAVELTRDEIVSIIEKTPMSSQCQSSLTQVAESLAGTYPFSIVMFSPFERDAFRYRVELNVFGHGASLSNPLDRYLTTGIGKSFDLSSLSERHVEGAPRDPLDVIRRIPVARDLYVNPDTDSYVRNWPSDDQDK